MGEKKRKSRDEMRQGKEKGGTKSRKMSTNKKGGGKEKGKRTGPRLPNALLKELDRRNSGGGRQFDDDDFSSDGGNDLYEYEEDVAEEDAKKNRRFDAIKSYDYELPEDFVDENVQSDDDDDDDHNGSEEDEDHNEGKKRSGAAGDEKHLRMLQEITQMPGEAFEGRRKKNEVVVSEPYPESEYNPSRDVLDGDGRVTIGDLLGSLQQNPAYSKLRKEMRNVEAKSIPLSAPLSREAIDKVERQKAYEISKKDITKWEPLIKRNREAPSIIFDKDIDVGFSTVGAIASEFEPRTEFEKKMASLVHDVKVIEAHKEDGAKLLELNKISLEDYKNSRDHIAKMRTLLFRHELKMKRLKKIKSKTHRRILKKDKMKAASGEMQMDAEAAKELATKQEFKRAEERLTLRHKNKSKWAKRVLERGLNAQDEGTRAAITEQLSQHARLTRKMNSMNDSSDSDNSSDEEYDEDSDVSERDRASKVLMKAKEKTQSILEEEDEVPTSGVLSLPFMKRGLKKQKDAAIEEAKLALQEYESSLNKKHDSADAKTAAGNGRRVFGGPTEKVALPTKKRKLNENSTSSGSDSDSGAEFEAEENIVDDRSDGRQKDVRVSYSMLNEGSESNQEPLFADSEKLAVDPSPKTTYEVAIFESNTWRKMNEKTEVESSTKRAPTDVQSAVENEQPEETDEESDSDDGGQMIDGKLSSGHGAAYELPSQAELIHEAFAGDDVEEEFAKYKDEALNKENPEPEKPVLLPGWGQWTNVQKKKGLPSWMEEEHKLAKQKRDEAIKKRKDARLKHVVISEKLDKKAEKLHTKTLPFPFTSQEVFEQSIRMPIGPDFNPATAVGALNRPEVLKKPGVIIKPINYEDVDSHEKVEHNQGGKKHQKQKQPPKVKTGAKRHRTKPVVVKS